MTTSTTALASTGIGSGIDVNTLVTQLMTVERQPETLMDKQTSTFNAKISAYGQISSSLSSFQSAAGALGDLALLRGVSASVADSSIAGAAAAPGTAAGTYALEVQKLAQSQALATPAYASTLSSVGTGTLTIDFGTYSGGAFSADATKASAVITIAPGQDALGSVRDAINAAGAGVSASIVNDGTGQRLVLTSRYSGAAGAMRIGVTDDDGNSTDASGLSALAYDASTGGTTNLAEVVTAQDAKLVVNGITVSSASNSVSGAIEGVTLNLSKAAPGTTTTLSVSRNVAAAASAVQSFVQSYNNTTSTLSSLSAYDSSTNTAAILQGDSTLLSVQSRIRSTLSSLVAHAGGYASLSELGIAFQKDGSLTVNSSKLNAALNDPTRDAAGVFAVVGTPSDNQIAYTNAGATAVPGNYAVQVDSLATHGAVTGSAPTALTITTGSNDTLALSVDGVAANVTLAAGTYTATALASMIQARVNAATGLSTAGSSISATANGGVLALASARWGSASTVTITGGTAVTDLFGTVSSTSGADASGSIGGIAATGSGQSLTAQGITIGVSGGATGARGSINFSRGIADGLNTLITNLLTSTLTARTSGLQTSISNVASQRAAFENRMTNVEAAMRAQFVALDTVISSMQNTSSFLSQQLAALNNTTSTK